jgi:very-short-patch-repair endonuclease
MSDAEVILWTRLRRHCDDRPKFRRQHPIGSVIADFYCPSVALAIEVDGRTHWDDDAQWHDWKRDRWLKSQGVTMLRIPASRIYSELNCVVDGIHRWVAGLAARQRQAPEMGLAPSTLGSSLRSASGPPPPRAGEVRSLTRTARTSRSGSARPGPSARG